MLSFILFNDNPKRVLDTNDEDHGLENWARKSLVVVPLPKEKHLYSSHGRRPKEESSLIPDHSRVGWRHPNEGQQKNKNCPHQPPRNIPYDEEIVYCEDLLDE